MRRLMVVFAIVLLTACQGYYQRHILGNEESPYFFVPVDSVLKLTTSVSVPAHTEHVFFQDGVMRTIHQVNRYLPYCELKVSVARGVTQVIKPDKFVVFRVYGVNKNQLARTPFIHAATMDDLDGEDFEVVATVMELYSERQPDVRYLLCAAWGLPQNMSFVTIGMIRGQLSGFFKLDLRRGDDTVPRLRIPAGRGRDQIIDY